MNTDLVPAAGLVVAIAIFVVAAVIEWRETRRTPRPPIVPPTDMDSVTAYERGKRDD
jgi:hypothetical protein